MMEIKPLWLGNEGFKLWLKKKKKAKGVMRRGWERKNKKRKLIIKRAVGSGRAEFFSDKCDKKICR